MLVNVIALVVAIGLGVFSAVYPERASKRWGPNLADFPPRSRIWALRSHRIFGIIFAIVAALFLLKVLEDSKVAH